MKYFIVGLLVTSQLLLIGQTPTEKLNKLLQRKTELERSISFYQKELKEVEDKIEQFKKSQAQAQPTIVSESGQKIVATVGDNGAVLRTSPSAQGIELMKVPANATIYVHHEHRGLYFKTTYYGKEGWINYTNIQSHPEIDAMINKTATTTTNQVVTVDESDPKYQRLLKIYGKEKAVKMMTKQLWKGMSHGQVKESLGKPVSQARENTAKGLKEEWNYSNQKLVFLNGSLLSW